VVDPRSRGWRDRRSFDEGGLRSGREVRHQGERGRIPARGERADAHGAHLSTPGGRTVSDASRSARRRLEQQGPHGERADGPRGGGERRPRGGRRPDARAGRPVSRVDAGRKLRRPLAQVESRRLERRGGRPRRAGQLQRRSRRRAPGHAPARCALQRDSAVDGLGRRRDGGVRGDAPRSATPTRATSRPRR
jgi:hypothetical protein